MRVSVTISHGLAAAILASAAVKLSAEPVSPERSYQAIAARNPFGLRPPPAPQPVALPEEPPAADIKLTGISSIIPPTRAYMMLIDPKDKKSKFYSLTEQDIQDGIEVLDINEVDRSVNVRYGGKEILLTFETHGAKLADLPAAAPVAVANAVKGAANAGAAQRGVPIVNTSVRPLPGSTANTSRNYNSAVRTVPSRMVRTGLSNSAARGLDRLEIRGSGDDRTITLRPEPVQERLSSEEQAILLEIQRAANPGMAFPPTPGMPNNMTPAAPGE